MDQNTRLLFSAICDYSGMGFSALYMLSWPRVLDILIVWHICRPYNLNLDLYFNEFIPKILAIFVAKKFSENDIFIAIFVYLNFKRPQHPELGIPIISNFIHILIYF